MESTGIDFIQEERLIFEKLDDAAEAQDWDLYDELCTELEALVKEL